MRFGSERWREFEVAPASVAKDQADASSAGSSLPPPTIPAAPVLGQPVLAFVHDVDDRIAHQPVLSWAARPPTFLSDHVPSKTHSPCQIFAQSDVQEISPDILKRPHCATNQLRHP